MSAKSKAEMNGSTRGGTKAKDVEEKTEQPLTVLWEHLASWRQDNHYIRSAYRPDSGSYIKSASSLGHLHNESVNIYTHLLGAGSFAIGSLVLASVFESRYKTASREDVFVFSCFFAGAVGCLGMSATYHTIMNHSEAVGKVGNKLDYLGIVCLIWGSFVPSIYYGFFCEPRFLTMYLSMITILGAGCGVVSMAPKFSTSQWRPFRAGMFMGMGLSAVIPVLHGLKIHGMQRMINQSGLPWVVLQGALYIAGAVVYAVSSVGDCERVKKVLIVCSTG